MITFRDPPPLRARVQPPRPVVVPRRAETPVALWSIGLLALALTLAGHFGVRSWLTRGNDQLLGDALRNTIPDKAERGARQQLPAGTPMRDVVSQVEALRAVCRVEPDSMPGASTRTCVGQPVIRSNSYTRMVFRFSARDGRLTGISACPAAMHWSSTALPMHIAAALTTTAGQNGCWRHGANVADNEWGFATLPDRRYTVALVHASDSLFRRETPTADTLIVRW